MLSQSRYTMPDSHRHHRRHAIVLVSIFLLSSIALVPTSSIAGHSKTTSVWSGTVNLVDGYTVESGDILIIEEGTIINLGDD